MTSEEKAKELYNKFYNTDSHQNSVTVRQETAKQCALIAVDEILDVLDNSRVYAYDYDLSLWDGISTYWQDVKNHLNNL